MCRRMLGTHAQGHQSTFTPFYVYVRRSCCGHLARPFRVIVPAKRMAFPVIGQKDAAQIFVAIEEDSKEIEKLALVPSGIWPHRGDAIDARIVASDICLQPQKLL